MLSALLTDFFDFFSAGPSCTLGFSKRILNVDMYRLELVLAQWFLKFNPTSYLPVRTVIKFIKEFDCHDYSVPIH